jgi:hypothetical protein
MTAAWRELRDGELDHERLWLCVGLLSALVIAAMAAGWEGPRMVCPLKAVVGVPCPGCGATRAAQALAAGQVMTAARLNPLAALAAGAWVLWAGYAAVAVAARGKRLRLVWEPQDVSRARWLAAGLVLTSWLFLVLDGR